MIDAAEMVTLRDGRRLAFAEFGDRGGRPLLYFHGWPGARGALHEGFLYSRPWGFRLEDIPIEAHLWHGERDGIVPVAMGRHVARLIPRCVARFDPNDAHISLVVNHMREILETLAR